MAERSELLDYLVDQLAPIGDALSTQVLSTLHLKHSRLDSSPASTPHPTLPSKAFEGEG
jgi:hypothetical protein